MAKDKIKDVRTRREIAERRRVFANARRAETAYAATLRKLAKVVADLIAKGNPDGSPASSANITSTLHRYGASPALDTWARARTDTMLAEVDARNREAWLTVGHRIGRGIAGEIAAAPVGSTLYRLRDEQVRLIKSLPTEAAERVNHMTVEGIAMGRRPKAIVKDIMATGGVTESRANLIARTEVARTAAALVQTRAESVGSEGYIWRTSNDHSVRLSHKRMDGKFVGWGRPPTLDGLVGHAGALPNCRCFAEVVFPEAPTFGDEPAAIGAANRETAGAGPLRQDVAYLASPERVPAATEHRVQRAARRKDSGHRLAYLDPAKLNRALKLQATAAPGTNAETGETQFHVSPTENHVRTAAWQETLLHPDLRDFPAPVLTVTKDRINVDNGRHRIAAMSRMNMRAIPTSMSPASVKDALKKSLVVAKPKVKAAPKTRLSKTSLSRRKTGG